MFLKTELSTSLTLHPVLKLYYLREFLSYLYFLVEPIFAYYLFLVIYKMILLLNLLSKAQLFSDFLFFRTVILFFHTLSQLIIIYFFVKSILTLVFCFSHFTQLNAGILVNFKNRYHQFKIVFSASRIITVRILIFIQAVLSFSIESSAYFSIICF